MEDAEIVDLFFQRSEQAIPETAAKYQGLIFQISRNILENPQDAEECVNDTYLGLWNAIPPHRPNPLLAFVCRVARNVSLNRYRHNHAQRRDESRNLPLVELEGCLAAPSAEETWSAQALGQTLDCFLDTLDRKSRVMFLRRYWFSDSVSWIARQMGITKTMSPCSCTASAVDSSNIWNRKEQYDEIRNMDKSHGGNQRPAHCGSR